VSAATAEHFADEEATAVPAMEHALTRSEENWLSKHGRAATPKGQLLTKGFDQAFLVAAQTSSRDSPEHSNAARSGEATGADAAAVPAAANLALQSIGCSQMPSEVSWPAVSSRAGLQPAETAPTPNSPRKPISAKDQDSSCLTQPEQETSFQ
jgi:hypothetical protein